MNQKEQIEKDVAQIRGFLGIVEGMFGPAVNPSREALARLASALTAPQPEASDREMAVKIVNLWQCSCDHVTGYDRISEYVATLRADERRKSADIAIAYNEANIDHFDGPYEHEGLRAAIIGETTP